MNENPAPIKFNGMIYAHHVKDKADLEAAGVTFGDPPEVSSIWVMWRGCSWGRQTMQWLRARYGQFRWRIEDEEAAG